MKRTIAVLCTLLLSSFLLSQSNHFQINGVLLGSDGKPIPFSNVHVLSNAPRMPRFLLQSMPVAQDGKFQLHFQTSGLFRLEFTGIDHYSLELPLFLQNSDSVVLMVRLKAYELADSLSNIRIIGDFNNFAFSKGAQPMLKQADGTYAAILQVNADTLAYQLLGAEKTGRSINGTQSDYYVYDGGGDYRSVIRTKARQASVIFTPSKLVRMSPEAVVTFQDETSLPSRFYNVDLSIEKEKERFSEAFQAHRAAGKQPSEFSFDLTQLQKRIHSETDPIIKNQLLLASVQLGALNRDSTIASSVVNTISPIDPLWSYNPVALMSCIYRANDHQRFLPYLQEVIGKNHDKEIKPFLISELLNLAKAAGADSIVSKYYQILVANFEDSPWTRGARARFAPTRIIQAGKPVPDFSVTSLEDSSTTFTNKKLIGTIYLIDFWAVWCAPCVAEMKSLHEAYDHFKSKGFTILSASADFKPEDVAKFRKANWPMPWLHTFLKNGSEDRFAKLFEVVAIPKPVLVGRDGKILATEDDLRGNKLQSTLSKAFAQ